MNLHKSIDAMGIKGIIKPRNPVRGNVSCFILQNSVAGTITLDITPEKELPYLTPLQFMHYMVRTTTLFFPEAAALY